MRPERFRRVDEIYHSAAQRNPSERAAFLREVCGDDEELRREVESLFAYESRAVAFMETPPTALAISPSATPIMPGTMLSHYRIIEKIGSGGMGVVYRAHDERLIRDVAIKLLPAGLLQDSKSRRRLQREAQALSKLCHPNVAVVYDFDTVGDIDFLVMELVGGTPLRQRIAQGSFSEDQVIEFGMQLAKGLEAVHNRGVIHRDLKPENLRLAEDGRLKILDFGLAVAVRDSAGGESVTDANSLQGTLAYMPPEQLMGHDADVRSDIYASGAVLYEMATGRKLYNEDEQSRLIYAIIHDPPVSPESLNPSLSPELSRIIRKCLDKNPTKRYQSARELAVDLGRLSNSNSQPAIQTMRSRRNAIMIVVIILLLIAVSSVILNLAAIRDRFIPHARISSLAVLPLDNLSRDPEQEYFADGITDALITELAQINALRVVSRTSVMQYKRTQKSSREIARELDVDAILEGSIARFGDRVRITAQLVRGANDQNLWAEAYERDVRDVLLLQDEVARSIAKRIEVKLTPAEQQRLARTRPVDPEAYELYLKGRYFWVTRTEASIQKAIDAFKQAIEKDPNYAAAYSGLADCYSSLGFSFDVGSLAPHEVQPKALSAVRRAIELDDSLAEAHSSLAFIKLNYDWDLKQSEMSFKRSIELNPGWANGHHWYAHNLMSAGRVSEAEAESRRALQLDPLSPIMNTHLGWHYYFAHEYDKSLDQLRKTLELMPNYGLAFWYSGWIYEQKGMYSDALTYMERARELLKGNLSVDADIGHLYAVSGNKSGAERMLRDLQQQSSRRYVNPFEVALIYVGLGNNDKAFEWLDSAYRERSDMLVYINVEPRLDPIRTDSRFMELVRKLGIPRPEKVQ